MSDGSSLSDIEFSSLQEVAKGFDQGFVPPDHATRLVALGLIYRLLGSLRITTAGRARIARGA